MQAYDPAGFGKTLTFRRTYWKSPRVFFGAIFLAGFFLLLFTKAPHMPPLVFVAMLLFFFFLVNGWGFLVTITIAPEGLHYKSPLKQVHIPWQRVNSLGVYQQGKYGKRILFRDRYNEVFYFNDRFIYVSTSPSFVPGRFVFQDETYVDFHYRAEAWDLIEVYTNKHRKPSSYIYTPGGNLGFSQ